MSTQTKNPVLEKLREEYEKAPGSDAFVDLAGALSEKAETRAEAREICFRGLSQSADNHRGRLMLARLFYLDGYAEFCVRELQELQSRVKNDSLERLLRELGVGSLAAAKSDDSSGDSVGEEVFADVDLDAEIVEILDDLDGDEGKEEV